ncbi:flagellar assembly protein FliH [Gracilibacillus boraciitolerans]|uniref:flagellar assembly protein FliH n=1 Tax=Gracilibacillus boraciitolerans TaxID=307521 RepID=UPI0004AD2549|nr:flagellar assembly protein FliH [Gracilibacillus boraciitolerans]
MSNNPLPPRQIQLRKIEVTRRNYSKFEAEDELQSLNQQIEEAEASLQEIVEKTDNKKETAQAEIIRLKEEWEQEKIQLIQKAQQDGYQQGFEQGKQDSLEQYQAIIHDAVDVLENAKKEYHKIVAESDETVLQIAMTTSEKVLHQLLDEEPSRFLAVAKSVVEQVKDHPKIKLFVSSKYFSLLLDNKDELNSLIQSDIEFMIYPSTDLIGEQIVIETPFGRIDASVDSQLQEIRSRLFHVVEEITRENTNVTE